MKRMYLNGIICASALGMAASASSSVIVKVDGSRVVDATGQPLGRIENIVLSPVGCAEAAILTASNGRLIPIPWTFVRVSGDARSAVTPGANLVFTLNVDQARLAQAPGFTRAQWPDMTNPVWLQGSMTFFGPTNAVGGTGSGTNVIVGAGAGNRIGGAGVATNSTSVLPPTGRPNPGQPEFNPPPAPQPTPGSPPSPPQTPENRPGTAPGSPQPSSPQPGSAPPASPRSQP